MRHPQLKPRFPTLGEAPGTLLPVGNPDPRPSRISLIEYNASDYRETEFATLEQGLAYQPQLPVLWLNVYGLTDPALLQAIGQRFGLHPLVLEDILNTRQRPKVDDYGDYLFIATRVYRYQHDSERLQHDQVYLVIGNGFVLSFQTQPLGVFATLRERLAQGRGQLRQQGADYLAYGLLDAIIDDYFGVIDQFNTRVEQLDKQVLSGHDRFILARIQRQKQEAMRLRRALVPLREVLNVLPRGDYAFFQHGTLLYLRDAFDHTLHLIESLETAREVISGMLDLYMSAQSNRLNVQMRVLTVITIIFMPLTLIAGIYGMNFDNMPELHWHYGYYGVMAGMLLIALLLGFIFWRRRWL
ncbi:magnesium/cobalt transporter CorA [Vogesella oryzae]|uniref:magnesium/cobalt transporter CorA n=1 Tax=Vogesella oryzae TaxID=1735285 RepID=UPI001582A245|nr:magnesium/cobalt transporter CorA [Vogesella oryzae]